MNKEVTSDASNFETILLNFGYISMTIFLRMPLCKQCPDHTTGGIPLKCTYPDAIVSCNNIFFYLQGMHVPQNKQHAVVNGLSVGISQLVISITAFKLWPFICTHPNSKVKINNLWKCWNWSSIMSPLALSHEDAHICAASLVSQKHFPPIWYSLPVGLNFGSPWLQGPIIIMYRNTLIW